MDVGIIQQSIMSTIRKLLALAVMVLFCTASGTDLRAQAAGNAFLNESFQASIRSQGLPHSTHNIHQPNIQTSPVFTTTDSTIYVDVSALMNVQADKYVAIFALEQVGSTLDSATQIIDGRIDAFIDSIRRYGIAEKDIHIDVVSQVPMYSYQVEQKLYSHTFNEIPIGFSLRKNIHVGYKDSEILGKLVSAAARQEIYDIVKVEYIVNDVESVYDSLRREAISTIQKKLKDFSKLGLQIASSSPMIAEGSGATMPIERYVAFSAFGSSSIKGSEAGRGTHYGHIEVNPADKPKTIYYNRIPFTAYDLVLNPSFVKPVVQFTYRLTVQYRLERGKERGA